ncbi:MAG: Crp/Fnr family transcriptional regulator [Terriglobales bacterium]
MSFLNGLSVSAQSLDRMTRETSYSAEAVLFMEGQPSPGVMVIVSGKVKLSTASADGRTIVVRIAGPGEVLGLSATVVGRPCELTAETLEPARIKIIPRESFKQWLRAHPELAFQIAQELAEEYNNTCQQLRSMLMSHTATQRLARTLLQLVRNSGPGNEARAPFSLTHQEIAEMIGSSRETVTRLLSGFRHKGMIEMEGSTLIVHDREALRQLGHGDGAGFGF